MDFRTGVRLPSGPLKQSGARIAQTRINTGKERLDVIQQLAGKKTV